MNLKKICFSLCAIMILFFSVNVFAENSNETKVKKMGWKPPSPEETITYNFSHMKRTIEERKNIEYLICEKFVSINKESLKNVEVYKFKSSVENIKILIDSNFVVAVFDENKTLISQNIKSTRYMGDTPDFIYFDSSENKKEQGDIETNSLSWGSSIEVVFRDRIEVNVKKDKDYYICMESLGGIYLSLGSVPSEPKIKIADINSDDDDPDENENRDDNYSISTAEVINGNHISGKADFPNDIDYYLINLAGMYILKVDLGQVRLMDSKSNELNYKDIHGDRLYEIPENKDIYLKIMKKNSGIYNIEFERYYKESGKHIKYEYDKTNTRLQKVVIGNTEVIFNYDANGNLISKRIVKK